MAFATQFSSCIQGFSKMALRIPDISPKPLLKSMQSFADLEVSLDFATSLSGDLTSQILGILCAEMPQAIANHKDIFRYYMRNLKSVSISQMSPPP